MAKQKAFTKGGKTPKEQMVVIDGKRMSMSDAKRRYPKSVADYDKAQLNKLPEEKEVDDIPFNTHEIANTELNRRAIEEANAREESGLPSRFAFNAKSGKIENTIPDTPEGTTIVDNTNDEDYLEARRRYGDAGATETQNGGNTPETIDNASGGSIDTLFNPSVDGPPDSYGGGRSNVNNATTKPFKKGKQSELDRIIGTAQATQLGLAATNAYRAYKTGTEPDPDRIDSVSTESVRLPRVTVPGQQGIDRQANTSRAFIRDSGNVNRTAGTIANKAFQAELKLAEIQGRADTQVTGQEAQLNQRGAIAANNANINVDMFNANNLAKARQFKVQMESANLTAAASNLQNINQLDYLRYKENQGIQAQDTAEKYDYLDSPYFNTQKTTSPTIQPNTGSNILPFVNNRIRRNRGRVNRKGLFSNARNIGRNGTNSRFENNVDADFESGLYN